MKVLIIVHALTGGGAERVAACWANGLSEIGNEVFVMSDFTLPVTYSLNNEVCKIQIPESSVNFLARHLIDPIRNLISYHRIFSNISPDVILSVMHIHPLVLKLSSSVLKKRPLLILTDHNVYERPEYAPLKRKDYVLKFYFNRLYDVVTVLTHRDAEILKKRGFENVEIMHNPLFLSPIDIVPPKDNIVLAVGRMDGWKVKGFDLLIQAWNRISLKYPSWRLRIVGKASTTSLEFLRGLIGGNNSIELVDYTQDIVEEYRKAKIFVLSSRYEGWGLVLVEAMSQGCACIACDYLGRQAEIIENGVNGVLIVPNSINNIANAIDYLISDENSIKTFQKNARESVKQFSGVKIAEHWMALFDKYIR